LKGLRVDGGASANNLLMQMQADFLDREILRPRMTDTTALGAAMMAGLAAGIFKDLDQIRDTWREDRRFVPSLSEDQRQDHLSLWREGLARV
jgi:glycerol kinase